MSEDERNELISKIISEIADGKSLRETCRELNAKPSNFLRWIESSPLLVEQYARAMQIRSDIIFDEILDIADDGSNDLMTIQKGDESYEMENKEVTNRSKLRVDARKWVLAKMQPKKYGDKMEIEQTIIDKSLSFDPNAGQPGKSM